MVNQYLLAHLSFVDFALQGAISDETVDVTRLVLAIAINATDSLCIVAWIPRRVEDHHAVCSNKVDAQATHTSMTMHNHVKW